MHTANKKTKVLFVITKSNWGGAQKYVYELATGLDQNNFIPVVALGGNGELAKKLHESHIRVIHVSSLDRDINPLRDFASFRDLLRIMRDERPNAVHLNSSKIGGLGSVAAHIAGIPRIIFTAHGWAFNEDRSFFSRLIIKFLYFITIKLCDVTIAVSKAVATDAPAWGMHKRVAVIYPPASSNKNLMDKNSAREYLIKKTDGLKNDDRLWIGIVAELHKNKGIIYAINAMRDTTLQQRTTLVIVGSGQEELFLQNAVRANNLEKSIFFAGFEPDAATLMSAFDIFLLPSITEAFGYVLIEAGLAGIPVVASRVGGVPEIIEDNKTGLLVSPRHHNEIRDALCRLSDSTALRTTLGSNLQKKVEHYFSAQTSIATTAKLYKAD